MGHHTARTESREHARKAPTDASQAWHYDGANVLLGGKEQYAERVVRESVIGEID